MNTDKFLVNESIRAPRIQLIDVEGKKLGQFLTSDAISLAFQNGMDLVMVDDGAIPTCKMMDFGKFVYSQRKKQKNKQTGGKLKEVQLSPTIDLNDFNVKASKAREFLSQGHKVKVSVMMRGRQQQFKGQAFEKCESFLTTLSDVAQLDGKIDLYGKNVIMLLTKK